MAMQPNEPLSIAIVGGGITGVCLAIGLLQVSPHIKVAVYEQAASFAEIGAGVAFGPNAMRAMTTLHPDIQGAVDRVATSNTSPDMANVWFEFVDGHTRGSSQDPNSAQGDERFLFRVDDCNGGGAVHRAHFLDELIHFVPVGVAQFGKHLSSISAVPSSHRQTLHFADGTTATHDAIIGCDGIKSRVRAHLLPPNHPAATARYSHKYAYRGLIPMDKATATLGAKMAQNCFFHVGPRGHILTFPVAQGKLMNVVAFVQDDGEWTSPKLVVPATKADAMRDFAGWHPRVGVLLDLLLDDLDRWAIFDTFDHPLPYYNQGTVVVAGDAAHASSPHHGAGAGMGIEDAAVLKGLLQHASECVARGNDRGRVLEAVFAAFDGTRRERTQWLVSSSRKMGNVYDLMDPDVGTDPAALYAELNPRCRRIWDANLQQGIQEAVDHADRTLAAAA